MFQGHLFSVFQRSLGRSSRIVCLICQFFRLPCCSQCLDFPCIYEDVSCPSDLARLVAESYTLFTLSFSNRYCNPRLTVFRGNLFSVFQRSLGCSSGFVCLICQFVCLPCCFLCPYLHCTYDDVSCPSDLDHLVGSG